MKHINEPVEWLCSLCVFAVKKVRWVKTGAVAAGTT
jgi:hypothetical protein